jgi:hypothetical protein
MQMLSLRAITSLESKHGKWTLSPRIICSAEGHVPETKHKLVHPSKIAPAGLRKDEAGSDEVEKTW